MFGAVKLTTNPDSDHYKYSCYGIGLDVRGSFLLSDSSRFGKSVIIFGADMSSSVHVDKKKIRFLQKLNTLLMLAKKKMFKFTL